MTQHADKPVRVPFLEGTQHGACIKVISVGGGGSNAINRMIDLGLEGVEFVAINTDRQSLRCSKAKVRLQLGARLTHGLGAGADLELGRRVALDESDRIVEVLEGADMAFITAGLGGGTGTGSAPVIASASSGMGALTVAVVTLPFAFEGKRRMNQAERGLHDLLDHVDTLIVIHNDQLLASAKDMGFFESFQIADDVLRQAVQGISDIITVPGVINRDFADVRTTMAGMGYGVMGTAFGSGPKRASDAALAAIASPLLVAGAIEGARGILINIAGSNSLKLSEVHEASAIIQRAAHEDASIIFGAILDERLGDEIRITVIATGFDQRSYDRAQRRLMMRQGIARLAPDATIQPPPQVDTPIHNNGLTNRNFEHELTKPTAPEVTLELAPSTILLPDELHSGPAKDPELRQVDHVSPSSSSNAPVSQPITDTEHKPLDAPLLHDAENPYEDEELLSFIEGLPFDLRPAANTAAVASSPEVPIQSEIVRVRQAAIAAYAAVSTRELESGQAGSDEETSFAEILQLRQRIHDVDGTESDHRLHEKEMLYQERVASNDVPPQLALSQKDEPDGDTNISRLRRSPNGSTIAPSSKPDIAELPFIDSAATPYPATTACASVEAPAQRPVQAKSGKPDFNQRLNRKPDFFMEVEVI